MKLLRCFFATTLCTIFVWSSAFAATVNPPRSNKARCWNTSGNEVSCANSLQNDGSTPATAARFVDNADGTVKDNSTGLLWLKNADCFGAKDFTGALVAVSSLANGACGLVDGSKAGDWRLPRKDELLGLADCAKKDRKFTVSQPFLTVTDWYWTATKQGEHVYYFKGSVNACAIDGFPADAVFSVWAVRGGK